MHIDSKVYGWPGVYQFFFAALARINCQIEQLGKRCFYQRAPGSFMQ